MTVRSSHAVWEGTLKEGQGSMKVGAGHYEGPFTYASRFESGDGTNPEELIGAAHAGCYSMFLSALLSNNGFAPTKISTTADVHLGRDDAGPAITKIVLTCEATVPDLTAEQFADFAAKAKAGCPISKALGGVGEIVLDAKLV
ncbi:MAG: OsmC family peroxiredoxin [Anaerolineales bacterium]|nr:OsmC family peroxiredoxin [Anaerolineales bacterium]